ncbi:MAG: histidyl-tRNA synthetase [Chlamydiae bacterium SM23_39]|nr:MAG: histidyl-tRNA synthetase [Chlamydiae bacterium SM23_39]
MYFQIPRGLFDILPFGVDERFQSNIWQFVEKKAKEISSIFGFQEARTPIFERTEVFIRGVGETSDIVTKEMYTFFDKSNRSMTLRPEGTAGFIRAFVEKKLYTINLPYKFYYIAPMFRYDRPQKGRYRQHHQFGIEFIGEESFFADAEVIELIVSFYKNIGIKDFVLNINSVGDIESRKNYKQELLKFLKPKILKLSKDSRERYEKNPLRILDSKKEEDILLIKDAPSILNFLNENSKKHFENLLSLLDKIDISYLINDRLVRGLDYYTHIVFEVTSTSLGAQNSIGGGGRYDGLIKNFNGPDLSAVGFGTGIERIIETILKQQVEYEKMEKRFLYFIALDEKSKELCFKLVSKIRKLKIPVLISFKIKKLQKALKIADSLDVKYVVIIGPDEIASNVVMIKEMEKKEQKKINLEELIEHIKKLWGKYV